MRIFNSICLGVALLASAPVWSQQEQQTGPAPALSAPLLDISVSNNSDPDRMLTPPPVSGDAYPIWFTS
jgi:hypothetical protein